MLDLSLLFIFPNFAISSSGLSDYIKYPFAFWFLVIFISFICLGSFYRNFPLFFSGSFLALSVFLGTFSGIFPRFLWIKVNTVKLEYCKYCKGGSGLCELACTHVTVGGFFSLE